MADLYPSLAAAYPDLGYEACDPEVADGLDMVFFALPHGASAGPRPRAARAGRAHRGPGRRLPAQGPGRCTPGGTAAEHRRPELLAEAVFGIPELYRTRLTGATLVAAAGCYVTAARLALAPLVRPGRWSPTGIVVDTTSGVSGAGRAAKATSHFCTVDEDFCAYGLLTTATPPRSSRPRAPRCCSPPTWPR